MDNKKCVICGKNFSSETKSKYCSDECRQEAELRQRRQNCNNRKARRKARKGMDGIETGKPDKMLKEVRKRNMTYAELQKEKTMEKIRIGEL
jgi:hypothetical protein